MRLSEPRIQPSEAGDWNEEQRALMEKMEKGVGPINIMRTLVRHEKLLKRWLPFTNHILFKSTISRRERELLILRTAWDTQAVYEWAQHVVIARDAGITDGEIARVREGSGADGWSASERALLAAADELIADKMVGNETWAALSEHYSEEQLMDVIFTVGNYTTVAMALNSIGVQLDEGLEGF